jgi:phospholipase/carboxylesterase
MLHTESLKTYHIAPLSGIADSVVIFLHGLGDSGAGGLLEIGRVWQRALPNTEFLCPDAPFAFDMAPPEHGGRQWFSLKEYTPEALNAGIRTAAPILDSYIDEVLASRNLKPNKLALVGFSQGTIMALHVAPRRATALAAIVGYSGRIGNAAALPTQKKCAPPVLLVHGTLDEVLPFTCMAEAEAALKAAAIPVRTLTCPYLGHSIDESGVNAGVQFLQQYL